ncbi:GNAT family N-acetyltransferase [Herbaspirillum lusitanum]|uniref:GNAT family N-acetyltransferase n=1 Tax=Herbaspirillum lusitanum TaxID=213312 RepID=A0ABW9A7Y3_9BURK
MHTLNFSSLAFGWQRDTSRLQALIDLFLANGDHRYISHSELQSGRALSPASWAPDLPQILRAELSAALAPASEPPENPAPMIAVATLDQRVLAMALVSIERPAAARAFATLEDLLVHPEARGAGVGSRLLEWLFAELKARAIHRLFLESGMANAEAHAFFGRHGFHTVSVVMMREEPSC